MHSECYKVLIDIYYRTNILLRVLIIDSSKVLRQKLQSVEAYMDEMRDLPHTHLKENIATLAHLRGHSVCVSTPGAYATLRRIFNQPFQVLVGLTGSARLMTGPAWSSAP